MKAPSTRTSWKNPSNVSLFFSEVQKSPDNLREAFRKIAQKTGNTERAVSQAWYKQLRNLYPQFTTGSSKTVVVNRKNTFVKTGKMIHETQVDSKVIDGIRIVTIKQYYI